MVEVLVFLTLVLNLLEMLKAVIIHTVCYIYL